MCNRLKKVKPYVVLKDEFKSLEINETEENLKDETEEKLKDELEEKLKDESFGY